MALFEKETKMRNVEVNKKQVESSFFIKNKKVKNKIDKNLFDNLYFYR